MEKSTKNSSREIRKRRNNLTPINFHDKFLFNFLLELYRIVLLRI